MAWSEAEFDELVDCRFGEGGPVLLAAKIDDKLGAGPTIATRRSSGKRIMKGLGTGHGGPLDP